MSVIDLVTNFLIDAEYIRSADHIDTSESLIENGYIDSVGIIRLINLLEDTYKIKVHDDEVMPENFDSLMAIEAFLKHKNV